MADALRLLKHSYLPGTSYVTPLGAPISRLSAEESSRAWQSPFREGRVPLGLPGRPGSRRAVATVYSSFFCRSVMEFILCHFGDPIQVEIAMFQDFQMSGLNRTGNSFFQQMKTLYFCFVCLLNQKLHCNPKCNIIPKTNI